MVRIQLRNQRLDLTLPRLKQGVQFVDEVGLRVRQVDLLALVVAEVEEFQPVVLEVLDQLPVAPSNRAGGSSALVGVVRVVPEQGFTGKRGSTPE